ncbi:MAG TPA: glutathione S-transferase family protein [Steroidobacteraceae bacterium]|nr:glutathione S-transferase family protein [Steroidobacteraceae bacterium]
MLELYHYEPSANSMKPMLCLKEKGLEFVSRYVDLHRFEQHAPEFVKVNPNGQVPALLHDGTIITESTVINEYLDDVFPQVPLRPRAPAARAQMRIWSKFVDEYFCPALSMHGWNVLVPGIVARLQSGEFDQLLERIPLKEQRDKWKTAATHSFTTEQLADSKRKVGVSIERMEKILSKSKWLAGEEYSLADVNSFSMVVPVPRFFPEFMNDRMSPRTLDWVARMNQRPAVKAALAMARQPAPAVAQRT